MQEINLSSVADFLRCLLPTGPHFPHGERTWLFRGQSDAAWGLIPSIYREKSWTSLGGVERFGLAADDGLIVSDEKEVERAENQILNVLGNVVDRMGLDQALKLDRNCRAFAQHLGLPTRLLDWTVSPMVAAYFAASGAASLPPDGQLAVFSISDFFAKQSAWMHNIGKETVPGVGNPNLVAQQGVFTFTDGGRRDIVKALPVRNRKAEDRLSEDEAYEIDNHVLKLTLPRSDSRTLLRALREMGVHGATVFPGTTGISRVVSEVILGDVTEG